MGVELTEGEQARRWTGSGGTSLKAYGKHYQEQVFLPPCERKL